MRRVPVRWRASMMHWTLTLCWKRPRGACIADTRLTTPPASRPVRDSPQHLKQGTSSCLHFEHWNKNKIDLVTSKDRRSLGREDYKGTETALRHWTQVLLLVCVDAIRDVASGSGFVANRTLFHRLLWRACAFFLFYLYPFVTLLRPARCFHRLSYKYINNNSFVLAKLCGCSTLCVCVCVTMD